MDIVIFIFQKITFENFLTTVRIRKQTLVSYSVKIKDDSKKR